MFEIKYETFQLFISKIDANKLKVFIFRNLFDDIQYFDDDHWKEIIFKYLSEVKQFCFQYYKYFDYEYESPPLLGERNQFISSFWIQWQLVFEVKTEHQSITDSVGSYE